MLVVSSPIFVEDTKKKIFDYNFGDENLFRDRYSTDIRDTDSYSDLYSLFQVVAHSNLLFNNSSYKKSLSIL